MRNFSFLLIVFFSFMSCKNETTLQKPQVSGEQNNSIKTVTGPANTLPFIPLEVYKSIAETTTGIDVIPYGTTVTMNISEQASCYRFIASYILDTQVSEVPCTKPQGRIFFNKNGESFIEADIYFNTQCKYLIFFKSGDTKPIYATQISEKGLDYFSKLFSPEAMTELQKLQRGNQ